MKILRIFGVFAILFGMMNFVDALGATDGISTACDDNGCQICTEEGTCVSTCLRGYYGIDGNCTICSADYADSQPPFNTVSGQCYKQCDKRCDTPDSDAFGLTDNFTISDFLDKPNGYQIEFLTNAGNVCVNNEALYCPQQVYCNGTVDACKPQTITVNFYDEDGSSLLGTRYTVLRAVWSMQDTNSTQSTVPGASSYSGVFYPVFITPYATSANGRFLGWFDSQSGGNLVIRPAGDGAYYGNLDYTMASNITGTTNLYARYEDVAQPTWIAITIDDKNNGTNPTTASNPTVLYKNTNSAVSNCSGYRTSQSCRDTEITSITIPTLTGYTYGGHYTQSGGNGTQFINNNGIISTDYSPTTSITVYAKWTQNTPTIYTVRLNSNGGSGDHIIYYSNENYYCDNNATQIINSNNSVFTKCGFGAPTGNSGPFNGYFTQQTNGNQTIADNGNIILISVTADTVWYAQYGECKEGQEWDTEKSGCVEVKPSWVTVSLDDNGADTASAPTMLYLNTNANVTNCSGYRTAENCSDEYSVTNLTTLPTKDGYTYQGHRISTSGEQLIFPNGFINQNIPVTENTVVIADWLGNCNEVKFDDNNNTTNVSVNSENMQHKTSGDSAWKDDHCKSQSTPTTLAIPLNDNARFLGYYTEQEQGQGTPIFDNTGNVTTGGNEWIIYAPATLYAHWECEDDYTWNELTKTCDKLYYVYCERDAVNKFPLEYGAQGVSYNIQLSDADIRKNCNTTCETDYTWDGNFDLYIDEATNPYGSPVNIGPSGTLSGMFHTTYDENSYVILRPHCVQTTTSVKYLCYVGDTNGWIDNDVSLTDYTVKGVGSYTSCAINNNDPVQEYSWKFSGDGGLYAPGDIITPWNYGADKTFTPTYTASFTCENEDVWVGTAPDDANVQLGEQYTLPFMPCTLNTDFNGWVETDGAWEFERSRPLVSPILDATCNATNGTPIQFSSGDQFAWKCPENITFRPMIKFINKSIEVSCGTGGTSQNFDMTYNNQQEIQQDIIDFFNSCGGTCPLDNPNGPHGYNRKVVCANGLENQNLPNEWEQIENDTQGRTCYKTPAENSVQMILNEISLAQITNLNIYGISYCPQRITYKCSQDATDVYDEAPYAVYNKPYTTLTPETVGCGDTGLGFNNWRVESDGAEYSEHETVSEWPYEDEVTLVAQWGGANTYHIYYMSQEQDGVFQPITTWEYVENRPTTYTVDELPITILATPSREYSTFVGWCTDAALTQCSDDNRYTILSGTIGDMTLYAKWACEMPYHMVPATGYCEACDDNMYWDGEQCQRCGEGAAAGFPHSTAPFNWSIDQCYKECEGTTCLETRDFGTLPNDVQTTDFQQTTGTTKQISFYGNHRVGLNTCEMLTNTDYCPYAAQLSGDNNSVLAFKPTSAPVDFWDKDGHQIDENQYEYFVYGPRSNSDLSTGWLWSRIVGPAQNWSDNYTLIFYPTYKAPSADQDGFTFNGYYNPRYNGTQYIEENYVLNADNAASVIQRINGSIQQPRNLYAANTANGYTVTYNCGGYGTGANDNVTYGTSYTVKTAPEASCVWDGHTFNGWLLNDSNQTQYAGGAVINQWTYTIPNPTFTAQWSGANTYQITYTPGYESSDQSDVTQNVVYGANFTTKGATTFARPGYIMTAWQEPFPVLSTEYVYDITDNTTLNAHWDQCNAGTQPNTSNDQCEPCQGGTYGPNGISCEQCPDGYTQSAQGATADTDCYRNCSVSCTPVQCPENSTCTQTSTMYDGTQYYGGTCNAMAQNCEITEITCAAGYFLNEAGTACEPCPTGTTSPAGATNVSQCSACPYGQYIDNETCTNCPDGFNHSDPNATSMYQCYHDCETACTNPTCPANATSCEYGVNPASGAWYYGENACNATPLQCPITYIYCEPGFGYNATNNTCEPCTGNSVSVDNSCEPCEPGYAPNAEHTACDPITYTITYNCGTGNPPAPESQTGIHYGDSVTPQENTCEKPGYNFQGWSVSNPTDIQQPGVVFTWQYEEDKVFTAKWSDDPNTYAITYTPGYTGSGQSNYTQNITFGAQFQTQGRIFTRDGHIMTGWSDPFPLLSSGYTYQIEGNTTLEAQWRICEDGTQPNEAGTACEPCPTGTAGTNGTCEPCDPGYAPNAEHTACEPITYTIRYNPNGAPNSSPQTRPATYNQSFSTLGAIFTRPGYEMTGWSAPFPIMEHEYTYTRTQDTVLDAQWRICQAGEYWESGECEPCPEHHSSNPGAIGIDACFLSSCDDPNQHLFQGQCEDNEIECTAPNATYAIRTWNPALTAYGSCQIQECEVGYHIASNACVLDEQTCNVPNGRGERQWTGTQWGDCFVTQCNPGFEPNNAYTECRECDNRRVDGEIAVSSYASECEIATCMYHGQKYILEGNECHPICNRPDDETGHMEWNESTKKCVRTCNQGYKMW